MLILYLVKFNIITLSLFKIENILTTIFSFSPLTTSLQRKVNWNKLLRQNQNDAGERCKIQAMWFHSIVFLGFQLFGEFLANISSNSLPNWLLFFSDDTYIYIYIPLDIVPQVIESLFIFLILFCLQCWLLYFFTCLQVDRYFLLYCPIFYKNHSMNYIIK